MLKNHWPIFAVGAGLAAALVGLLVLAGDLFSSRTPATPTDENQRFIQEVQRLGDEVSEATPERLEGIERELLRQYRALQRPSREALKAVQDCDLAIARRKSLLMGAR